MEIQRLDSFLQVFDHKYFERVHERTRRVILCVPPEQLEWTYKPGAFTFGDLIRHLGAIERCMFAENAQCRPSRYPGHGTELAEGYDATLAFYDRMHEERWRSSALSLPRISHAAAKPPAAPRSRSGNGCDR